MTVNSDYNYYNEESYKYLLNNIYTNQYDDKANQQSDTISDTSDNTVVNIPVTTSEISNLEIQSENSQNTLSSISKESSNSNETKIQELESRLTQYSQSMTYMSSQITTMQNTLNSLNKQIESKKQEIERKQQELENKQKKYQEYMDEAYNEQIAKTEEQQEKYDAFVSAFKTDYANGKYNGKSYSDAYEECLSAAGIDMVIEGVEENSQLKSEINSLTTGISNLQTVLKNYQMQYNSNSSTIQALSNSYNNIVESFNSTRNELLTLTQTANSVESNDGVVNSETTKDVNSTNSTNSATSVSSVENTSSTTNIDWSALYVEGKGINFNNLANLLKTEKMNSFNKLSISTSELRKLAKTYKDQGELGEILEVMSQNSLSLTKVQINKTGKDSKDTQWVASASTNTLEYLANLDADSDGFISAEEANTLVKSQNAYNTIMKDMSEFRDNNSGLSYDGLEKLVEKYKSEGNDEYAQIVEKAYNNAKEMISLPADKTCSSSGKSYSVKYRYENLSSIVTGLIHNSVRKEYFLDELNLKNEKTECGQGKTTMVNGVNAVVAANAIITNSDIEYIDNYLQNTEGATLENVNDAYLKLTDEKGGTIKNDPRKIEEYWASGATKMEPDFELAESLGLELKEFYSKNGDFMGWGFDKYFTCTYVNEDTNEESNVTLITDNYGFAGCKSAATSVDAAIATYLRPKLLLGLITQEEYDKQVEEMRNSGKAHVES